MCVLFQELPLSASASRRTSGSANGGGADGSAETAGTDGADGGDGRGRGDRLYSGECLLLSLSKDLFTPERLR